MLEQYMTPEVVVLAGGITCFFAVIALILAGRRAFVRGMAARLAALEELVANRQLICSDIGQKKAESEEWQRSVQRLEQRFNALTQDINPLEEKHLKALSAYEDANRKLGETKQEWEQMRERVDLFKTRLSQLDSLEKEIKQLGEQGLELKQLNAEIPQKKAERDSLANEIKKLEPLVTESKELAGKIEGLRAQQKGMEDAVKGLQGALETLTKQVDSMAPPKPEERYQDLWKSLNFPDLPRERQASTEHAAFDRMKNYVVTQLKLKFPDRVLLAFHTALKSSHISPITVLAGISGTGKSLLPKCYAEGMGMHFVSLAVQPRWDSPQDLFGFYNYLEKRYKATDLARAMVQFEQYNRGEWPLPKDWNDGRQDRMLLVLLDEMNLARIEYYFSDFLSRLETRRDVRQLDSPVERAKAEIALDMGSLAKEEKPIRLFPGDNVLFTGTMNEDESTQTLSDKVLDRSCVLRFGKPNKVGRYETGTEAQPRHEGLALDTWKQWHKERTALGGQLDELNDWIDQLNACMNEVGRPFGHRVILAIQTYMANYPDWAGNRDHFNWARADQIEQRIMPKLRGLDVDAYQDSLDRIQRLVDALDDRPLSAAFRHGREDRTVFVWQGLDRTEDM